MGIPIFFELANESPSAREGADFNMGVDVGMNAAHPILARRKYVADKFSWEPAIFMVGRPRRTPPGRLSKLQEDSEAEEVMTGTRHAIDPESPVVSRCQ